MEKRKRRMIIRLDPQIQERRQEEHKSDFQGFRKNEKLNEIQVKREIATCQETIGVEKKVSSMQRVYLQAIAARTHAEERCTVSTTSSFNHRGLRSPPFVRGWDVGFIFVSRKRCSEDASWTWM